MYGVRCSLCSSISRLWLLMLALCLGLRVISISLLRLAWRNYQDTQYKWSNLAKVDQLTKYWLQFSILSPSLGHLWQFFPTFPRPILRKVHTPLINKNNTKRSLLGWLILSTLSTSKCTISFLFGTKGWILWLDFIILPERWNFYVKSLKFYKWLI